MIAECPLRYIQWTLLRHGCEPHTIARRTSRDRDRPGNAPPLPRDENLLWGTAVRLGRSRSILRPLRLLDHRDPGGGKRRPQLLPEFLRPPRIADLAALFRSTDRDHCSNAAGGPF